MRLLLVLLTLAVPASAQTLTGRVVDATTQEGLPGANVAILGSGGELVAGAATDLDGAYRLDDLPAGAYRVRATFVGYETQTRTDVVLQGSRPTFLLFELRETLTEAEGVTVTAGFFDDEPDAPVSVAVSRPKCLARFA